MSQSDHPDFAPELSINQHIARITLSRPGKANRLSPDDLDVLRGHIESVNLNQNVRVLQIVALGKYFCSGYDISSLASTDAPSSLYFGQTVDLVEQARPVTVAAIQGGVYGGGTDLALACDFRVGSTLANMFMPATRLGLHFYPGGMRRYVTRLGLNQAKRLFLTAEKIDAQEMHNIGFLTQLTDPDQLEYHLTELTNVLLSMAPLALVGVKHHLNRIAAGQFDIDAIESNVLVSEKSEDIREGALAWKEKRAPNFKGR